MNTNKLLDQTYIRDRTSQCQPALPADPQIEKPAICPVFINFVKRFALELDFRCISTSQLSFSMLKEPSRTLRTSLVQRLAKTRQTHSQWVRPTSDDINERNHVFGLGTVAAEQDYVCDYAHLRVTQNGLTHIWIATSNPLNAQEAIEAAMWFRITHDLKPLPPNTTRISDQLYMPVPLVNILESQQTKATARFVDGPRLVVPGFAQRIEALLAAPHSGWQHQQLTRNQQDLLYRPSKGGGTKFGFAEYHNSYLEGVKCLALGMSEAEATEIVANSLASAFDKFARDPDGASKLAKKYILSVLSRRPIVSGSYSRRDEVIQQEKKMAVARKRKVEAFHSKPLAERERLLKANGIKPIHEIDF
jgi:hypothetical protein